MTGPCGVALLSMAPIMYAKRLIESQGYIGRSWGCPAVAPEVSQPLIDLLKEGSRPLFTILLPPTPTDRH